MISHLSKKCLQLCFVNLCLKFFHMCLPLPGWATHNPIKAEAKDDLYAFAKALAKPPFRMESASCHLVAWLNGTMRQAPCLNDSYCMGPALVDPERPLALAMDGEVLDLEPAVARISLTGRGRKRLGNALGAIRGADDTDAQPAQPSKRAKFVYSTAVESMGTHMLSWAEALALAEACWSSGAHKLPAADEDAGEAWASCDAPAAEYDIIG